MSRCNVVVVLSALFTLVKVACTLSTCQANDFSRLQTECRDQNKRFLESEAEGSTHSKDTADNDHDSSALCEALYDVWRCVAQHIPKCFNSITTAYSSYAHSPYNCAPSKALVLELQKLRDHGGSGGGSAAVTDESTQASTSVTPSASPGSQKGDDGKGDNKGSNISSHTGIESSAPCCFDLSLIIASWLMATGMLLLSAFS